MDPALIDDPYPTYAALRAAGPLVRGGPATWAVTRHADISALLRDPRIGHEFPEEFRWPFHEIDGGKPNDVLPTIVSALEPPAHTRVRRLMGRVLTPTLVRSLEEPIRNKVSELLAAAAPQGVFDVLTEFALPLQTFTACSLIGVPAADQPEIARRGMELGRILILYPFVDPVLGKGFPEAEWLRAYVTDLVRRAPSVDPDGLVARLLAATDEGESMTEEEVIDNVVFLFFAGFETSMHAIAQGSVLLAKHPDQADRLRTDPSWMPNAVSEILRFDAPIQWISRMTKAPVQIGPREVKAGRVLLMLLGSANRDEREYDDPDTFDITRSTSTHLSFGGGIHRCLGVQLARLQASVALSELLQHHGRIELAGEPTRRPHQNLRGYTHVPVVPRPGGPAR